MSRKFVQAAITVQIFSIITFEDRVGCAVSSLKETQFREHTKKKLQGETPNNVISEIKLHEADELVSGLRKALVVTVVAIPVQDQMSRKNAAS